MEMMRESMHKDGRLQKCGYKMNMQIRSIS